MSDSKVEYIRRRAYSGVVTKSHGLNRDKTKIDKRKTCCIDNLLREICPHFNLSPRVVLGKRF